MDCTHAPVLNPTCDLTKPLRTVSGAVYRNRHVILGNVIGLGIVLALVLVFMWANATPDASNSGRALAAPTFWSRSP